MNKLLSRLTAGYAWCLQTARVHARIIAATVYAASGACFLLILIPLIDMARVHLFPPEPTPLHLPAQPDAASSSPKTKSFVTHITAPKPPPHRSVRMHWEDERLRMRAAGMLLLDGALEDASFVLAHASSSTASFTKTEYEQARQRLPSLFQEEISRLRLAWHKASPAQRRSIFDAAEQERYARLARLLQRPVGQVRIWDLSAALPDRLALPFFDNLHAAMVSRASVRPSLTRLLLAPGFPTRGISWELYRQRDTIMRHAYADLFSANDRQPPH